MRARTVTTTGAAIEAAEAVATGVAVITGKKAGPSLDRFGGVACLLPALEPIGHHRRLGVTRFSRPTGGSVGSPSTFVAAVEDERGVLALGQHGRHVVLAVVVEQDRARNLAVALTEVLAVRIHEHSARLVRRDGLGDGEFLHGWVRGLAPSRAERGKPQHQHQRGSTEHESPP